MWWWLRVTCNTISKYSLIRYQRSCMYQMYWQWEYILYCTNIVWIADWSNVCRIVCNKLILVDFIRINMNWVGIFVIPTYRIVLHTLPTSKSFLRSAFSNFFCIQGFTFTFHCAMSQWSPEGKIRRPDDVVEDAPVDLTVRLWYCGHGRSLWGHPSAVIYIPPEYGNISTTIQNPKGEVVLITVSHSGCLVRVENGWFNIGACPIFCVSPECVCNTYQEFYIPSYFIRQWDLIRVLHTILLVILSPSGVVIMFASCTRLSK